MFGSKVETPWPKCMLEQICLFHGDHEVLQGNSVKEEEVGYRVYYPRSHIHVPPRNTQKGTLLFPLVASKLSNLTILTVTFAVQKYEKGSVSSCSENKTEKYLKCL